MLFAIVKYEIESERWIHITYIWLSMYITKHTHTRQTCVWEKKRTERICWNGLRNSRTPHMVSLFARETSSIAARAANEH